MRSFVNQAQFVLRSYDNTVRSHKILSIEATFQMYSTRATNLYVLQISDFRIHDNEYAPEPDWYVYRKLLLLPHKFEITGYFVSIFHWNYVTKTIKNERISSRKFYPMLLLLKCFFKFYCFVVDMFLTFYIIFWYSIIWNFHNVFIFRINGRGYLLKQD